MLWVGLHVDKADTFSTTLVTATIPNRLSKGFKLDDNSARLKVPGGQLADGLAETEHFTSLVAFADTLSRLTPANAMVYGICGHDKARIVAQDQLATVTGDGLPVVARTREFFNYPSGPAIMMIDHDVIKGGETIPDDVLLNKLYGV